MAFGFICDCLPDLLISESRHSNGQRTMRGPHHPRSLRSPGIYMSRSSFQFSTAQLLVAATLISLITGSFAAIGVVGGAAASLVAGGHLNLIGRTKGREWLESIGLWLSAVAGTIVVTIAAADLFLELFLSIRVSYPLKDRPLCATRCATALRWGTTSALKRIVQHRHSAFFVTTVPV